MMTRKTIGEEVSILKMRRSKFEEGKRKKRRQTEENSVKRWILNHVNLEEQI